METGRRTPWAGSTETVAEIELEQVMEMASTVATDCALWDN